MLVEFLSNGRELTAKLRGEIDQHTGGKMREEIDSYVERSKPLLLKLDFSKVKFMDSSGIGLIMGRYRLMKITGGKLAVINIPPHLQRIIMLSGIMSLGILRDKTTI